MMPALPTRIAKALKMPNSSANQVSVIALTQIGAALARKIQGQLPISQLVLPEKYAVDGEQNFGRGQFKATCQMLFKTSDVVICIMATGIVVRTIAPIIKDKTVDPAVLVIDERANHVISLLSGHVGGANAWTNRIAKLVKADPVITTATDTEHVQALDTLAQRFDGWYPDFKYATKLINGRLAAGDRVNIYIDSDFRGIVTDLTGFTEINEVADDQSDVPLVIISDKTGYPKRQNSIQVIPRVNVLGVGCRKGIPYDAMQAAFVAFCQQHGLTWRSFYQVGSITKKQHENAIHYLAATLNIPVKFYSADNLQTVVDHYSQSAFVKKTVGVGNVANTAAELASGSRTFTDRFATDEVTLAASRKKLKVDDF